MKTPKPEWEETLLLFAYGEIEETAEIRAELARNPASRAYVDDMRALMEATEKTVAADTRQLVPPASALARAVEHFEGQERASFLECLRSLVLVPALAGACALLLIGMQPTPEPLRWEMARLEVGMEQLDADLEQVGLEMARLEEEPSPWDDPDLELLLGAESPGDLLESGDPDDEETYLRETPLEVLDEDVAALFGELGRL